MKRYTLKIEIDARSIDAIINQLLKIIKHLLAGYSSGEDFSLHDNKEQT